MIIMSCHSLQSLSYISQSHFYFFCTCWNVIYLCCFYSFPSLQAGFMWNRMCCLLFSLQFAFLPLCAICYIFSKWSSSDKRGALHSTTEINCSALGCKGISKRDWGLTPRSAPSKVDITNIILCPSYLTVAHDFCSLAGGSLADRLGSS